MNAYIEILRPNVCLLSVLGIVSGGIITGAFFSSPFLVMFASVAAFLITGAGNAINDYFDYKTDKINAPKRAIPSGRISRKGALIYSAAITIAGLLFSVLITVDFLLIAIANSIVLAVYAWKMKAKPFIGNVFVSYLAASSFLASGLITGNFYTLLASPLLVLALISFLGTVSREIFKDTEDVKGDKKTGARTLPIVFGEKKAMVVAYVFLYIACIALFIPLVFGILSIYYVIFLVPAVLLCLYAYGKKPKKTQKLLKIVMYLSILGFIAGSF